MLGSVILGKSITTPVLTGSVTPATLAASWTGKVIVAEPETPMRLAAAARSDVRWSWSVATGSSIP